MIWSVWIKSMVLLQHVWAADRALRASLRILTKDVFEFCLLPGSIPGFFFIFFGPAEKPWLSIVASHFCTTIFFLLSRQKYFIGSSLHRPLILNTIGDLFPRYIYWIDYVLVRIFRVGLIKKALRKLKCLSLRNEIDVTNAWLYF